MKFHEGNGRTPMFKLKYCNYVRLINIIKWEVGNRTCSSEGYRNWMTCRLTSVSNTPASSSAANTRLNRHATVVVLSVIVTKQ